MEKWVKEGRGSRRGRGESSGQGQWSGQDPGLGRRLKGGRGREGRGPERTGGKEGGKAPGGIGVGGRWREKDGAGVGVVTESQREAGRTKRAGRNTAGEMGGRKVEGRTSGWGDLGVGTVGS